MVKCSETLATGTNPHWTFKQVLSVSSSWQLGPPERAVCFSLYPGQFLSLLQPSASPDPGHHFPLCLMICSYQKVIYRQDYCLVWETALWLFLLGILLLSKLGWDHHCNFHALIVAVKQELQSTPPASVVGLLIPTAVRCFSLEICLSCFIIHIIGIEYHLVNIFSLKLHRKRACGWVYRRDLCVCGCSSPHSSHWGSAIRWGRHPGVA